MKEKSHQKREKMPVVGVILTIFVLLMMTLAMIMLCEQLGIDLGIIGTN